MRALQPGKMDNREKICLFNKQNINKITDEIVPDIGRLYKTPEGNKYPSVTTILGAMSDNSWLDDWIDAIGEERANEITNKACLRGTSMHHLLEKHLLNEELDKEAVGYWFYRQLLIYVKKIDCYVVEIPLWSDKLHVAGRADCIGLYDNVLSIIDFKTSKKAKHAKDIENYFLQCTIYALMLYELTGVFCYNIVVLIATEEGVPQVFKRKTLDYAKHAVVTIKKYHSSR